MVKKGPEEQEDGRGERPKRIDEKQFQIDKLQLKWS